MTLSLDKRLELMFPVEETEHKARVLHALRAMFRDTVTSRWLGPDGVYRRRPPGPNEPVFRVQQGLQEDARRAASVAGNHTGVAFRPAN
jgi:polyphosphate kinase